jgi:hypothetical protein
MRLSALFITSLTISIRLSVVDTTASGDMVSADPAPPRDFCRQSAYRLVTPAVMLCAFGIMAVLWHWGPRSLYFEILSFIGIEPFRFPFLDVHAVLAAGECQQLGMDVYLPTPCDAIDRPHVYSPLWLTLAPAFTSTTATPWVGLSLDLLFILSLAGVLRPRTPREIWVYGLAAFSPTTVYAIERANNDLVVFLLILSGGILLSFRQPYRLSSYALFLLSGLLKYYPLALLVLLIRERLRTAISLLILIGVSLLSVGMYFRHDLAKALANIPAQSYFADSFSAQNLAFGVREILGSNSSLVVIWLLGALFAIAAAKTLRAIRLIRTERFDCEATEIRLLAIGAILLGACFFAGQNIDYRGIYFLLVIPGLVKLHCSAGKTRLRQFYARMIAVALFLMWEEFFRHPLHVFATQAPNRGLVYAELIFWLGREFVWWWLIAGLAAIVLTYLQHLVLANEGIVRLVHGAILNKG